MYVQCVSNIQHTVHENIFTIDVFHPIILIVWWQLTMVDNAHIMLGFSTEYIMLDKELDLICCGESKVI